MSKSKIAIKRCSDYQRNKIEIAVREAIDLLGGISAFIKPKTKVLVKPNLLMAKDPEAGITTHPEIVRAVIKLLKEIDCQVYLGDAPSVWGNQIQNVDQVYEKTGMKAIAREEKITVVDFDKRRWRGDFPLTTWLDECDAFVNIPKFKTHNFTILTGAVKNLYGLVSGTYKTELHKRYFDKEDFARVLAQIYKQAKPALTVVDAIVAMEGDGPSSAGKLRNTGLIVAGVDGVAIDSVLAKIMGIEPEVVATTKYARILGLGISDLKQIEVVGEALSDCIGKPFILPKPAMTSKLPPQLVNFLKGLVRYWPKVLPSKCIRCQACVRACPQKIIRLEDDRIKINYKGCISCFCCLEVCPQEAIVLRKSFFAKMLGL